MINAALRETRGPKTVSGIYIPSSRGFMDDLTLTTTTHVQARWMLTALTDVASWARMKFKASKSRTLIIEKGKTTDIFTLRVQNEEIPSIMKSPTKCLGKWFDASLQDRDKVKNLVTQVEDGLKKIDRSNLPGKYKARLYQHAQLLRLICQSLANDAVRHTQLNNRIIREDHQPSPEKMARSPTQFLQRRNLFKRATSFNSRYPRWWKSSRQPRQDLSSPLEIPLMSKSGKQGLSPVQAKSGQLQRLSAKQRVHSSTMTLWE